MRGGWLGEEGTGLHNKYITPQDMHTTSSCCGHDSHMVEAPKASSCSKVRRVSEGQGKGVVRGCTM